MVFGRDIAVTAVAAVDQHRFTGGRDNQCGGATLNVRLNSGDGTFVRAPRYGQVNTPYFDTATADVNGDGLLDLVSSGRPI